MVFGIQELRGICGHDNFFVLEVKSETHFQESSTGQSRTEQAVFNAVHCSGASDVVTFIYV